MNTKQKPICIQSDGIAAAAQQGVERALAARKRMTELSSEQTAEIGGGFYGISFPIEIDSVFTGVHSPIIYGGFPVIDNYLARF